MVTGYGAMAVREVAGADWPRAGERLDSMTPITVAMVLIVTIVEEVPRSGGNYRLAGRLGGGPFACDRDDSHGFPGKGRTVGQSSSKVPPS